MAMFDRAEFNSGFSDDYWNPRMKSFCDLEEHVRGEAFRLLAERLNSGIRRLGRAKGRLLRMTLLNQRYSRFYERLPIIEKVREGVGRHTG